MILPRPRVLLAAALLLAVAAPTSPPVQASAVPPGMTWSQAYLTSADGTRLHAEVFLPRDRDPHVRLPAILYVSPYVGSGGAGGAVSATPINAGPTIDDAAVAGLLERLAPKGYAFVQVTLRGYGGSGGCADFGGYGDQADVKAAVEWAASRPWSNGRVGMAGGSYSGWTGNMALATRPRGLAAVFLWGAIQSWYGYPWMDGLRYYDNVLSTENYMQLDLWPPSAYADSTQWTGQTQRQECRASWAKAALESRNPDPDTPWYRERDVTARASASRVPVVYAHGFLDNTVHPNQTLLGVFAKLRGPKWLWVGQWDHMNPGIEKGARAGRAGFVDQLLRFYDRYVKDDRNAHPEADPAVTVQQNDGRWRAESQWPPADRRDVVLPLRKGSYVDHPFAAPETTAGEQFPGGKGAWTFTQPLAHDVRLAGAPSADLSISSTVPATSVTAFVYDVSPDGTARLVSIGGRAVSGTGHYRVELLPQDWLLPAGHWVGLLVAGSAYSYFFGTTNTWAEVSVEGSFRLPILGCRRDRFQTGGPNDFIRNRATFPIASTVIQAGSTKSTLPLASSCGS